MALPEPVLSDDDIDMTEKNISNLSGPIANTLSKDPASLAVLRAMTSFLAGFGRGGGVDVTIASALAQKQVCFLCSDSSEVAVH